MRSDVAPGVTVSFGPLFWQHRDDCSLLLNANIQSTQLFIQFIQQQLPLIPIAINYRKEKFHRGAAHVGCEIRTPQTLYQNVQHVEI